MCLTVTRSLRAYFKIHWVAAQELHCCAAVLPVRQTHQKVCLPFASEPGIFLERQILLCSVYTAVMLQFIMAIWQYPSRTKLIKTLHKLIPTEVDSAKKHTPYSRDQDDLPDGTLSKAGSSQSEASDPRLDAGDHDSLRERLLSKLRLSLKEEDIDLLEELFVQEGIIFDPNMMVLDIDSACHDAASRQIASLVQAVEELTETVQELTDENETLRHQLEVAQEIAARAQCAATDWSSGLPFGFVPAAVLRLIGFMPD
ncbi:hypothetical protein ACQ4PT_057813 [Festuca glaucescens]